MDASTSSPSKTRHPELPNGGVGNCDIEYLRKVYEIPEDIIIKNCSLAEHAIERSPSSDESPFFASYFEAGLTLPMHPFTHDVLEFFQIAPIRVTAIYTE